MSNKNIEITNFDERPRKKILTSTRLPLITNLEEKLDINEMGNLRKLNAHKTKKHYKLKANNNLDFFFGSSFSCSFSFSLSEVEARFELFT